MSMIEETPVERRLRGRVHVWMIPVGAASGDLRKNAQVLDAKELERASRFSNLLLRRRYVDTHVAVRRILSRYLRVRPEAVRFLRTSTDKPLIAGADLAFNVSHSGRLAVCAVADRGEIGLRTRRESPRIPRVLGRLGVDIEAIRPVEDADGIVSRFFAPAEAAEYERYSGRSRCAAFFELWTHKEAFVKATGEGLLRPLDSFAVLPSSDHRTRQIRLADPTGPERWCLRSFTPAPGYAGALTLDQEVASIEFFHWTEHGEPELVSSTDTVSVSGISLT